MVAKTEAEDSQVPMETNSRSATLPCFRDGMSDYARGGCCVTCRGGIIANVKSHCGRRLVSYCRAFSPSCPSPSHRSRPSEGLPFILVWASFMGSKGVSNPDEYKTVCRQCLFLRQMQSYKVEEKSSKSIISSIHVWSSGQPHSY